MAIPISFEKLIRNNVVESARIEYKEGLNHEVLVHTISAFANDKMVRELYELNGDVPFDDRPNNEATIKDLKNNIIDEFLDNVDSDLLENDNLSRLDILKSLRIVTGSKENLKPVNVGLMFFNEHPDNFYGFEYNIAKKKCFWF